MLRDIQRLSFDILPEVYVVDQNRLYLEIAPQLIKDDVTESILTERERLLADFGTDDIPGLETGDRSVIEDHYRELGTTVAATLLVDPKKDLPRIREIMSPGYLYKEYVDFFAGDEQGHSSAGGSGFHDLVFIQDMRERYRRDTKVNIDNWGYSIGDESVERLTQLHVVDLVAHELGHTTVGNLVESVVLEPDKESGKLKISPKLPFDFEPLRGEVDMPEFTLLLRDGEYYNGPLFSEYPAAAHSVDVLAEIQGLEEDRSPKHKTYLYGHATSPEGVERYIGIGSVHSAEAYVFLETAMELYPVLRTIMTNHEYGIIDDKTFLLQLKDTLSHEIREAGYRPTSGGWEDFGKLVGATVT